MSGLRALSAIRLSDPGAWVCVWLAVSLTMLIAPRLATVTVAKVWFDLTGLMLASLTLAAGRRTVGRLGSVHHLAWVLPPAERENWRGEVAAVLHAVAHDPSERRRQTLGFVLGAPATAWSCWRIRFSRDED